MTRLKIFAIHYFPGFWSMGERCGMPSEYLTTKGFINAGYEVHFFIPFDGKKDEDGIYEGIYIHKFRIPYTIYDILYNNKIVFSSRFFNLIFNVVSRILFIAFATKRILGFAKKTKPDIIYHLGTINALPAYITSKIYRIPYITRLYGTFLYPHLSDRFLLLKHFSDILAYKLPFEYMIMTNDGTQGDIVAEKLGVPKEKLKFWMNGVNKDMYDPDFTKARFKEKLGISANTKIILAVSRLEKWKHVERTIKAAPYIVTKYKDVIFLIVGDGGEKTNLEKLSEELSVKNYVKFRGAVPYDDVKSYMNAADLFVSLYDVSNVGNPLLEAMVCGRCIVTLNTGATGEIIKNDYNGILLEYKDLKNLPRVILDLLNNDNLREKLGRNAREYALKHFQTWDERVRMEVELIEKVAMEGN